MPEKKQLRILCFGDSLTAGYHSWGIGAHPYAAKLKQTLETALPNLEIESKVDGVPGDLVVPPGSFLRRIQDDCKTQWDWVIFLGGTNDLGYGKTPEEIYAGLQTSWNVALDAGAKLLALTVPECAVRSEQLIGRRAELNELILSHGQDRFHAFNLHEKIPYFSSSPEFTRDVFDDGLHLTPKGYDLMGNVIGQHLARLLRDEGIADKTDEDDL
ncbi:SGNH hydrolase [Penicillium chermesinum]|uniref:SGNH hydrolase n=1 Tax=Penicillium chermesinum TaxID=63820 RepID=A0A9W9PGL7_9EURO|nr:SGNH hydrolase [Penicillium chermesinum]KAJ5246410.1 SGNH hydrolase [Penicillium chermesinum]KAJ6144689.1 SGNH hydrolase [Penicillium chermesinum]